MKNIYFKQAGPALVTWVLAHKMMYWHVAKEISFKDISIVALVAICMLFS